MCAELPWPAASFSRPWTTLCYFLKNFRTTWIQNIRQILIKTQKFRESQIPLKNKIFSFVCFLWALAPLVLFAMLCFVVRFTTLFWRNSLKTERHHLLSKTFRYTWTQIVRQKLMKTQIQLRLSKFKITLHGSVGENEGSSKKRRNLFGW